MMLDLSNIVYKAGEQKFEYNIQITQAITGIFGPSGAGKTTLMNIIAGFNKPFLGKILFNGKLLFDFESKVFVKEKNRKIGFVFQDKYLFPHLSVKQNLLFGNKTSKNSKEKIQIEEVIHLLEISELLHKKPGQLSGGEKQRVCLGRALLSHPEILLLDEPFTGLDYRKRNKVLSYLIEVNQKFQIPIVVISHEFSDIQKLTDNIILVEQGRAYQENATLSAWIHESASKNISPGIYLNIIDAIYYAYDKDERLYHFYHEGAPECRISANSEIFNESLIERQKVRFCIRPDDISLSIKPLGGTSIQNQIPGKVKKIIETKRSCFCLVNCGFDLMVEISVASKYKLGLQKGKDIFCLFKSKSIEVVHLFKKSKHERNNIKTHWDNIHSL